ncbi:uncharacterized protein [Halyomorpha halys]|uniref:uncharacterized protein n=1 Tax=Halyomorpha halys TaxID=286706 RepID=UPI0034D16A62
MEYEENIVFADDIFLTADINDNLQQAVTEWEAELERKTINVRKSKIMHIGREQEKIEILCKGEPIEMVDEYTYLGTVISRNGKVDYEISNRIKKENAMYYHLCNTVIEKEEVEKNSKVHIFKSIHLPSLL